MNCTVRFGKQFSESSPCLPGQQGTGQQGWYASGTCRKQFTKPTVQFILGSSIVLINLDHQGRFATYAIMPHLSTLLNEWRALLLSAGVHFDFDLIP